MQLGFWIVILLAVVQGLTEYLPVSSSGHLVIVETLLGVRGGEGIRGVMFEVAVHVGTLVAVLAFYRRRIGSLIVSAWAFAASGFERAEETEEDVRFILCLIVASIPVAIAGLFLRSAIAAAFDSPALVSFMLVVTGVFLVFSRVKTGPRKLTPQAALVIGAAQAIALVPGCSRSGWTITTGLLLGLGYEEAAEFSFILSVPAVLGALGLEMSAEPLSDSSGQLPLLALGALVAFVSGFIALKLLVAVLKRGRLHRFAYYLIPVGLVMILLFGLSS
jgi:undecaprenyl-diphosphatase